MKKIILVSCLVPLVSLSAHAVKLCKYKCQYESALNAWRNAGGTIGTGSTAGLSWEFTATSSPSGYSSGIGECFGSNTSATGNGNYCWCKMINVNSDGNCFGNWVYSTPLPDCKIYGGDLCGYMCELCATSGSNGSCTRSALFALFEVSSVECPAAGTCTNTNYKTIGDAESCGTGWVEIVSPTLTITGTYSDSKGSFTYENCAP